MEKELSSCMGPGFTAEYSVFLINAENVLRADCKKAEILNSLSQSALKLQKYTTQLTFPLSCFGCHGSAYQSLFLLSCFTIRIDQIVDFSLPDLSTRFTFTLEILGFIPISRKFNVGNLSYLNQNYIGFVCPSNEMALVPVFPYAIRGEKGPAGSRL